MLAGAVAAAAAAADNLIISQSVYLPFAKIIILKHIKFTWTPAAAVV